MVHGAGGGHLAELRLPCPHYGCLRKSVFIIILVFLLIFFTNRASSLAMQACTCSTKGGHTADYYLLPTGTCRPYRARACSHSRGTLVVENKMCCAVCHHEWESTGEWVGGREERRDEKIE